MTWTSLALLGTLAIVDGGFAGFRAAAGRSGLVFKDAYYRKAIRGGMRAALVVTLVVGLVAMAVALSCASPRARLDEMAACAHQLVLVLGVYSTLVLIALGVWSTAEADLRTLASVIILGPFTLIRPFVIAGAAARAAWTAPSVAAAIMVVIACGLQLAIEPFLDWRNR